MNKKLIHKRKDSKKWSIYFTHPHAKKLGLKGDEARIRKVWSESKKETKAEAIKIWAKLYHEQGIAKQYYSDINMSEVIETYKQARGEGIGNLKRIGNLLGKKDIKWIAQNGQAQQILLKDLNSDPKIKTVNSKKRIFDSLKALMYFAKDEMGVIDTFRKIKSFKIPEGEIFEGKYIDEENLTQLRNEMIGQYAYLRDPFDFALISGLRKSNIVNLQKRHIEDTLHYKRLNIPKNEMKAKKPFTLPLTPIMEEIILRNWHDDTDYIFKGYRGSLKGLGDFKKGWTTVRQRAFFWCRWHDIRHTCATNYATNGTNLFDLMALMGWASITMAQRYVHNDDQSLYERMIEKQSLFGTKLAQDTNNLRKGFHSDNKKSYTSNAE